MTSIAATGLPPRNIAIAIVGAGSIGSSFAYHLAAAGHDVTVVARPASVRLEVLSRDRAIVLTTGERAEVRVADRLDERIPYDLVLVTTLAHQVDAVLPALARSRAGAVQFMFNTFGPERLRDAAGGQRCSFGMQFLMAFLDGQGRLSCKINQGQKTLHGDPRWVRLFEEAGMPSRYESEMPRWLRSHAPVCVSMESICVTAHQRGRGATGAEAAVAARGMRAGFDIVTASGFRLYPASKAILGASPVPILAVMLWLISRIASFRTLLAGAAPECRAIIDAMATAAAAATAASGPARATARNVQRLLAMRPSE